MKISEAIKKIIKLKDFAVFDDYKRFIAMLADFSTDTHKKELNVFKNAVDDKMLKLCVDDTLENSRKILKLQIQLENKGLSQDWINFIIESFALSLGWNYTPKEVTQEVQQSLQNQQTKQEQTQSSNQESWTCSCGTVNTTKFCGNCGLPKPVPKSSNWTCSCGFVNTTKFCGNCGKPKPKQQVQQTQQSKQVQKTNQATQQNQTRSTKSLLQFLETLPKQISVQKQIINNYIDVTLNEKILKQLGYDIEYENKGGIWQKTHLKKNGEDVIYLVIPSTFNYEGKDYRITEIGDFAFYGCESLRSVVISNSVTKIADKGFCDCSSLVSLIIPDSVIVIDKCAFAYCSGLMNVRIPNSVTQIGISAFLNVPHIDYYGVATYEKYNKYWGAKSMN